ncbi:hypothetical protein HYN59_05120 [Flavobacterium album]|uniref:VCBS repeat-containing protein n=1 Tax=Flavobacterium album TaxID=2175091 RepID=A0A2S1QVW5_9FLAO|nr:hypothetical protein [Flavobacterium album]AWH84535.1 hypothetical protein HYN59_05120 [Flavobacterium album]
MLKKFFALMFIAFPCLLFAQERYIDFIAHERPEDAEYDSISWLGKDKIHQGFTLKGKNDPKCRLTVVPKGVVLLEQSLQNKWYVVDTLSYVVFPADEGYITPQFIITDFNEDGLEDFMFLPMTNMHGVMGYYIYMQDDKGTLIPLKNEAFVDEDDDSWPAANYDAATKTIHCEMPGGVFGSSWEATYRLEGYMAIPLEMHVEVRNNQSWLEKYFKGEKDRWALARQEIDVALGLGYEDYDKMDVIHYKLEQDGDEILKMYTATSDENENTITTYQETVTVPGFLDELFSHEHYEYFPGFLITDFNNDGDQDLVIYTGADVHGNLETLIFLADRKTKKLVKLQNTAEGTDVWDTPEYDPKTKTITCNRISGNAGLSFRSRYKLKGFIAEPQTKEVQDRTNVNGETGKGYSESTYKGKKGKWVLTNKVIDE